MSDSSKKPKRDQAPITPEVVPKKKTVTLWVKGQSGNPNGRPKGTQRERVQRAIEATVEKIGVDVESGKILRRFGKQIISEICRIALSPDIRVVRKGVVVMAPSEAKVKCLIACMDRLVPALKSIELKDDFEHLTPAEMSDEAIISLMQKMVNLATSGVTDELDG